PTKSPSAGAGEDETSTTSGTKAMKKTRPTRAKRSLALGNNRQTLMERGVVDLFDLTDGIRHEPLAVHPVLFPDHHHGRPVRFGNAGWDLPRDAVRLVVARGYEHLIDRVRIEPKPLEFGRRPGLDELLELGLV